MKRTYRRVLVWIVGATSLIFMVTACGKQVDNTPQNSPGTKVETPADSNKENPPVSSNDQGKPKEQTNENKVEGKVILDNYPAEIEKYLSDNKAKETQQALNINNKTYIIMTMGEKNTGGYSIELKDLILKDATLTVYAQYIKPGKDDLVSMAITYPFLVIETDKIYEGHYMIDYDIQQ